MLCRNISMAVVLLLSSHAFAGTYLVSPNGKDDNNGLSAPWLTIQHAIDALPAGDSTIELSPGTYSEKKSLDFSKSPWANLTIKSKDPANPAVITSADDVYVIQLAGGIDKRSLTFSGVALVPSKAARLVDVDVQNVKVVFDHCSLEANSAVLETTERSSEVKIDFLNCKIKSESQGLIVRSTAAVSFRKCALAWSNGPCIQGVAGSIVFDGCSVDAPATTRFFSFGPNRADKRLDLLQVSDCDGSCGRLSWEPSGIRRLLVTGNRIQWKNVGTVTVGAGPEVIWNQKAPVVNPAPYEKIVIAHNKFQFAEGTTHPIFLGKGADKAEVVDNVFIFDKARIYGVVVKSDNNLFEFNTVCGSDYAFVLAGSSGNKVRHNTVYSSKGVAFAVCPNQEEVVPPEGTYGQSKDNVVEDNIFISANGLAFSQEEWRTHHSNTWNTRCDRNVYWNMAGGDVIGLPHVTVPQNGGIAAVRAQWPKTYPGNAWMAQNDRNSVVADPLLSNPPTDFSLKPNSPALLLDKASNMNAGAWQRTSKPKQ